MGQVVSNLNGGKPLDILIKCPVHYEKRGTYIFDAEHNMVASVRGWGRISYMENPEEKQDAMGEFIAQAINEKLMGEDYPNLIYLIEWRNI